MMPNQQRSATPKGNAQGWEEGERPGVEERVVALTMQFDDMPMEIPAAAKGCPCWSRDDRNACSSSHSIKASVSQRHCTDLYVYDYKDCSTAPAACRTHRHRTATCSQPG
ncbi:hypothetical protein AV530_012740 [Patagioenas fasciata monilis]|uniref:Uncharacterized protein n=1 Tax=Patagioenas fasciata monilis TaxID=372326 RepID=A0A1V4JC47_PATFA|nr:hypothetical protein AV530_012740 [Patagioenas fasciata monilis]